MNESTIHVGDVPGILWTPTVITPRTPVLLLGHPGGLDRMRPRLLGRAEAAVAQGFAAATIELPGSGTRPAWPEIDGARADLRAAILAGERPGPEVVDRLVLPLVDRSVPEWQATIDELARLGIDGPVGISGGTTAIGVRLAVVDPRIVAVGLFAGSYLPQATLDEARGVTVPMHMLLQWDDVDNDRQAALELFDAFGSTEKTLLANTGGHTGVPASAGVHAMEFFRRHLRS